MDDNPQPVQSAPAPPPFPPQPRKRRPTVAVVIIVLVVIAAGLFLLLKPKSSTPTAVSPKGCVAQVFAQGSSGHCVADLQTLIDEMESGGYTECAFQGGAILPVSGSFDTSTKAQVAAVQQWLNCYTAQEGDPAGATVNGQVSRSTWDELCSYGYFDPAQSGNHTSSFYDQALAAGRDAGCPSLKA